MATAPAAVLDGPKAARWSRLRTPRTIVAFTISVGWVVCLAFAINSSSNCTPSKPSVCGPDPRFGLALGFWAVVPLLIWVLPVTGSLAAVVFTIFDVAFDPDRELRVIFGGFGVLCAALAVLVVARRRAQAASVGVHDASDPPVLVAVDPVSTPWLSLLLAALLSVGAVGLVTVYHARTAAESAHVHAADRQTATVIDVDGADTEIVVRLPSGVTRRISVADTGPYSVNSQEPVLIDPTDARWIGLVAEPADFTFWLTGACVCLLLALVLVARYRAALRARRNLASTPQGRVEVRVRFGRDGIVYIFANDDQRAPRPIASFRTVPVPTAALPALAPERRDDPWQIFLPPPPTPVTLRGTFADAGWVCIVTPNGVVLPRTRVQPIRARQRAAYSKAMWSSAAGVETAIDIDSDATGSPVGLDASREVFTSDPGVRVPPLPLVVPIGRGRSASAIAMVVGGFIVAPAVGYLIPISAGRLWPLPIVLGVQAVIVGVGRLRSAVVLTHRGLSVRGFWSTTSIGWTDIVAVARVRDRLLVALRRGKVFRLGPFAAAAGSDRYRRAQEMGAAITVLRDRAVAVGASRQPVSSKLSVGPAVLALYAVVTVLAMWIGAVLR